MPLPIIPDYCAYIQNPRLILPAILKTGHPIAKGNRIIKYSGGFCVVFPYETTNKKVAVRCWHAEISDARKRTKCIAEALKASHLPYFAGFDYYDQGIATTQGIQPVVIMDWIEASPLKKYIAEHLGDDTINLIAENFKLMVSTLHANHFSHGDLHHENILIKDDSSLMLVDYDSMYVPALKGMSDDIKGMRGYQHKGREHNQFLTEKADYFSELVIYTSLKTLAKYPELWEKLHMENSDTMLFSQEDITSEGKTDIFDFLEKDSDLRFLSGKLREFMCKASIEELSPLEDVLAEAPKNILSQIAGKWKDGNGYTPPIKTTSTIESPKNITERWSKGNGYTINKSQKDTQEKLANRITQKYKRR